MTLALGGEQLRAGHDLVIGQYLARTPFIEDLERLAEGQGARFHEVVLDLDAAARAQRLAARAFEHAVDNRLVGPDDATALVQSIESLRQSRPRAVWVDAAGSLSSTLDTVRAARRAPTH